MTVLDPVSLGMDLTAILHELYGGASMVRGLSSETVPRAQTGTPVPGLASDVPLSSCAA